MAKLFVVLLLASLATGCGGKTGYLPEKMGTSGSPPGDLTLDTTQMGPYWW